MSEVTLDTWIVLLQDADPQERVLALEGLTDLAPAAAHEHVEHALLDDDPLVRSAAARLANRVEPPLSVAHLEKALTDGDPDVRQRVVRALTKRGGVAASHALSKRLADEPDQKVLASLLLGLGKIGGAAVLPALGGFLAQEDDRIRANTVEAIDLVLQRAYTEWMRPLEEDRNNRVRANAAVALARFDPAGAARILASMVAHEDKWFRMSAAWAAGACGIPQVVDTVLPLLHDPDPEIRIQTLRSLAKHRKLPTREALQAWLENEDDPTVLQYAGEILSGRTAPAADGKAQA